MERKFDPKDFDYNSCSSEEFVEAWEALKQSEELKNFLEEVRQIKEEFSEILDDLEELRKDRENIEALFEELK